MPLDEFMSNPPSESCRRIDFSDARVERAGPDDSPVLLVRGMAPCINMRVFLSPWVYLERPDYWTIEVVACLPSGFCIPALKPFEESLPLAGLVGRKGIEVLGNSGARQIEIGEGRRLYDTGEQADQLSAEGS
jgi:hypothetical protein